MNILIKITYNTIIKLKTRKQKLTFLILKRALLYYTILINYNIKWYSKVKSKN